MTTTKLNSNPFHPHEVDPSEALRHLADFDLSEVESALGNETFTDLLTECLMNSVSDATMEEIKGKFSHYIQSWASHKTTQNYNNQARKDRELRIVK